MDEINEFLSYVETEFSIVWAASNPELFKERYEKFFAMYTRDFDIRSEARSGFLKLIAERKK